MNETLFYVLGGVLVAAALLISFVGLRWERFPGSRGVLAVSIGAFVTLVVATGAFAWLNAEDEQEHRQHQEEAGELPTPAEVVAAEEAGTSAEATTTGEETTTETTGTETTAQGTGGGGASAADGEQIFEQQGCGSCHTLQAAGTTGEVGPNLDVELDGKPASFIETSIVDPNAEIAKGYPPDVMPQNFEQILQPDELQALVKYIQQSVGSASQ